MGADKLTLVSENRLMKLLAMENELKATRDELKAAMENELKAAMDVVVIAELIEENLGSWEGPNATGSPVLNAAMFKRALNGQREALRQYREALRQYDEARRG